MNTRIKFTEIKTIREQMTKEQDNKCGVCEEKIDFACLDHNHNTGHIRKVLCRGCNCFLGKIENNLIRNKITGNKLKIIIKNLADYMLYKTDMIHPTYKDKKPKKLFKP